MEIQKSLREAGLTENESKIYLALLELGQKGAGSLAKKTGLHRRVVYDTLDQLIKKGLVGYILENKKKVFQPSNPHKLLEIKEEEKEKINSIMPGILEIYNCKKSTDKHQTLFFRGKEGLKAVFEDQLEELEKSKNKEILILGASPLAYKIMEIYFHWFDKKRIKEKIKAKILMHEKLSRKIPLSEIKYLPQKYSSPLAVNIYGDNIAIILWAEKNPFAVLIKQKEIAEGYRNYFNLLWKIAKV